MTQRMKATKTIEYRGRTIQPGEVFPVKPADVHTFNVQQSAELTNETEGKTTKRKYTRKASVSASSTQDAKPRAQASKARSTAKVSGQVTTEKRRYNRRDMQAK